MLFADKSNRIIPIKYTAISPLSIPKTPPKTVFAVPIRGNLHILLSHFATTLKSKDKTMLKSRKITGDSTVTAIGFAISLLNF